MALSSRKSNMASELYRVLKHIKFKTNLYRHTPLLMVNNADTYQQPHMIIQNFLCYSQLISMVTLEDTTIKQRSIYIQQKIFNKSSLAGFPSVHPRINYQLEICSTLECTTGNLFQLQRPIFTKHTRI